MINHNCSISKPTPVNGTTLPMTPSYSTIRDELLAEVKAGWSGETVLHTLETTQNDYQVLEEFGKNANISTEDAPDLWTAPDGCNIFPEI